RQQPGTALREPRQRRQREQCRVGTDLDVVLGAHACQRIGDVDRRERPDSLVHQVGGQRGEPLALGRIRAKPAVDLEDERHDRHALMLDGPDLQAVAELVANDLWKPELRIETERRQPRAIDGHQETVTGSDPGRASAAWPRGTMLRSTRRSKARYLRAALRTVSGVARR